MAARPTAGIHTERGTAFYTEDLGYIVPGVDYWLVKMGQRDHLNGPAQAAFPSERAAQEFANTHKSRDPHRKITVTYPDGYVFDLDAPMEGTAA